MTYELIGTPRVENEYSDEWETTMVCDVRREDGVEGDVWIVAGVPDYHRGSASAAATHRGYETVRVFGDCPDHWCPATLMTDDLVDVREGVVAACETDALATHRARSAQMQEAE